jgi:hypothetical protein
MKQHNGKEERKKISNMVWMSVQIMKIALFLSKLTIGNLLEVIKYKIICLKRSQLTKGM